MARALLFCLIVLLAIPARAAVVIGNSLADSTGLHVRFGCNVFTSDCAFTLWPILADVESYAVPGTLAKGWIAHPEWWPADLAGEDLLIMLGTVEASSTNTPADEFEATMRAVVAEGWSRGARRIILMEPLRRLWDHENARLFGYMAAQEAICATVAGVICGPGLFDLLDPTLHTYDGKHPNWAGDHIIADAVVALLATPEPGTALLVALGLAGLGSVAPRRRVDENARRHGSGARDP